MAGNCGFSIAPTRPEHRELIARTLENVEDMNVKSLAAGIPWDFATFPEYLASVERRGTGLNFAAYIGHTALRLFAMGDDAYERTATAGITNTVRTAAAAFAPLVTGAAFTVAALGVPFFASGAIKIVYDVLTYFTFKNVRPPEEEELHRAKLERHTQTARGVDRYDG